MHVLPRQDDEVADVVDADELPLAADEVRRVALVDLSERQVLVLRLERLHDAIDRQVQRGDLFLREVDVNLAAQAAVDGDRRDARRALEARRQVVLGQLAQRDGVVVAFDADLHDRQRVRVGLEDRRRIRFFRQAAAHAIEPAADVVGRGVEVRAPREVQADVAAALATTTSRRG